jgi:SPOR domain
VNLPDATPCPEIAQLFGNRRQQTTAKAEKAEAKPAQPAWGVQLLGGTSEVAVLASYYQLQKKYNNILGPLQPLLIRSPAGRNAYWYRVRIGENSRNEAQQLCSNLRTIGGSCLVQRN